MLRSSYLNVPSLTALPLPTHPSADGRFRAKSLRPSSTRSTPTSSHQAHRSSPHHIHHLHQRWGFPISTMGPNHKDSYFSSSEHKGDKYLYVQDRRRGRRFCLNLRKWKRWDCRQSSRLFTAAVIIKWAQRRKSEDVNKTSSHTRFPVEVYLLTHTFSFFSSLEALLLNQFQLVVLFSCFKWRRAEDEQTLILTIIIRTRPPSLCFH